VDFLLIFIFSLFAELIANDKPLLVRYQEAGMRRSF
jgi:microcin C transport system permease protein